MKHWIKCAIIGFFIYVGVMVFFFFLTPIINTDFPTKMTYLQALKKVWDGIQIPLYKQIGYALFMTGLFGIMISGFIKEREK
jgi:hypothetical protein